MPVPRHLFSPKAVVAIASALPFAVVIGLQTPEPKVSFARQVAPIMRAHCTSCHGPSQPAADLDLSSLDAIRKGGLSGPAVVSGAPDKSSLLQRTLGHGGKPRMPLGFAPLSAEKAQVIERWIAEGAKADEGKAQHWAYLPLAPQSPPQVRIRSWVRNPIDQFVLAKLEKLGLKPSSEADRRTLIRRVFLDLTGLPPSLNDVERFVTDKRPDAYDRLVDQLLASPHYGERQARFWLDLARYADTDGFADAPRVAWKYRDWVIRAFNQNMPFDQFSIQQLAGDLLPGSSPDRFIPTGFQRNSMFDGEMGGDPEEAHLNVIADRVSTTSTVWLGSTLQCARCHDHKYDPFTQKDFYAMAAFFNGTSSKPTNPGEAKGRWIEPVLEFATPKQTAKRQKLQQQIMVAERQLRKWTPEKKAAMQDWQAKVSAPGWGPLRPELSARSGARFQIKEDGSALVVGPNPAADRFRITVSGWEGKATGIRLEVIPDDSLPRKGSGRGPDGSFVINKVAVMVDGQPIKLGEATADHSARGFDPENLLKADSELGWSVFDSVDKPHELVLGFENPVNLTPTSRLTLDILQGGGDDPDCNLGRFRTSLATMDDPASWLTSAKVKGLFAKKSLTEPEQEMLDDAFFAATPLLRAQRKAIGIAKAELEALQESITTAMILQEHASKEPLKIPLRIRGEFLQKGPDVSADTPGILPPLERVGRIDRLSLAKWLMSKDNPLTARVLANRLWEQSFGRGLVETSEDFGTRGALPSHPELLDWMARELQDGWNIKAMQRRIVTSATYRQTSRSDAEGLRRDARNLNLSRGPKVRMDAETIRDASLAFGGLLNRKVGGPSVFPYQPKEATENNSDWQPSFGADANRRSLYTFLQRSSPFALFQIFDATARSECTVRRVNTTTPLQALALMNDKAMADAAVALGRRMLGGASNDESRLIFGFRICTARNPSKRELEHLTGLLSQLRRRYANDLESAEKLAGSPERSAWAMVGNVLLNLDETINRN